MIFELIITIVFLTGICIILQQYSNPLHWITHSRSLACSKDRHRQDCMLCGHVKKCLHHLHRQAQWLHGHPEMSEEILHRLKFLLPSGIIFKEQRQRLHNLADHIHKNHMPHQKQNNNSQLPKLHREISLRLQQLNSLASEQENRISNLHRITENYTVAQHYTKLHHCVKAAIKLQHYNRRLLKNIHRTERYLSRIFRKIKPRQT